MRPGRSEAAPPPQFTRRTLLGSAVGGLFLHRRASAGELPSRADPLLDELEKRACRYFYEQADPRTGLVLDRARAEGRDDRRVASTAATGFGLSALCIAESHGWLGADLAQARVERTLAFLLSHPGRHRGFFHHFVDIATGARVWASEVSSIDTTWLLCGILHCQAHFPGRIARLAGELIDGVDWRWMLDGGSTLCHGWMPETGFLPYRWDAYAEMMALYLLAIGSRTSPIPASCWNAWKRPVRTCGNLTFIDAATPLFTHQYSHAWFDFRARRDRYTDYFENSRRATEAHRQECIQLAGRFPWYSAELWGVTASDSRRGYQAWMDPACPPDGTLVPCAAGGSLPFLPRECSAVLQTMLDRYGNKVWSRYGFVDAFQPQDGWFSPDVIGINLGIMLLMAENARSESVWRAFMSVPDARRGMQAVGLLQS